MQIWAYAAIGIAGLAMGCVFKFPAVIVVSSVIVICIGVLAVSQGWPAISMLLTIISALLTLHAAYLIGLIASSALIKDPKPNSEDKT